MAKPWEKAAAAASRKPWEKAVGNAAPVDPADEVPVPGPPLTAAQQAAGIKQLDAITDNGDPIAKMWGEGLTTAAKGAPEAAVTMANNAIVQAGAGLGGMMVDPLMGDKAANFINETTEKYSYQPQPNTLDDGTQVPSSAQKLLGGVGEAMAPIEKGKSAAGEAVLNATGSPGLATAAYIAPDVAGSLTGMKTSKLTKAPGIKPEIVKPKVAARDMTPEQLHEAAADVLLKNNVGLMTSQRGGAFAKQAESLGRAADTILGKSRVAKQQLQQFTTAVLKKAGIEAKNATPDAMAELRGKVTAEYEDLTTKNPTKVDQQLGNSLANVMERAEGDTQLGWVANQIRRLKKGSTATPNGVVIDGKIAQEVRSDLSDKRASANVSERKAANEMLRAIDDAFERSNPGAPSERMSKVREQFHRMKQIEDSVSPDTGQVSPAKLLSTMSRKRNRGESVYGRGDQELIELAKAGKQVLQESVGNSGTATRNIDIAKIAAAFTHPVVAAKVGGAVMGGRLLNEGRVMRGTSNDIALQQAKRTLPPAGDIAAAREAVGRAAVITETEEQKKRRLRAEALRSN